MTYALAEYKEALYGKSLASRWNRGRTDKQLVYGAQRSFALQLIQGNEKLRNCTPQSIQNAFLDIAYIGLTLAPSQSLVYLIPYGDKATVTIGYRGLEQLAYRTGVVEAIQAALVCENDPVFSVGTGPNGRYVRHEEARTDRGDVTHSYCVAEFKNGHSHVEVMDRNDLEAVEEAATKRNPAGGSVWRSRFRGEMQKKAVIRRAWKHWPQDENGELERAQKILDTIEPATFEGEAVRIISERQVGQLTDLCSQTNLSTDVVCRAFGVASLSLIPEKNFDEAVRMVAPV
jgi:phage RecT family recombinase